MCRSAKYLIRDNHPKIITHATFKMAQMEMARRGSVRKKADSGITEQGKYSGKFALTDNVICASGQEKLKCRIKPSNQCKIILAKKEVATGVTSRST